MKKFQQLYKQHPVATIIGLIIAVVVVWYIVTKLKAEILLKLRQKELDASRSSFNQAHPDLAAWDEKNDAVTARAYLTSWIAGSSILDFIKLMSGKNTDQKILIAKAYKLLYNTNIQDDIRKQYADAYFVPQDTINLALSYYAGIPNV